MSVIVPAYNSVRTLGQTLASIQAQTFSDWEVFVSDDASTDGTPGVVEHLADLRFTLVRSAVNGGPAKARNLALQRATGELVAFLDADDWWLPDYLDRQVRRYDDECGAGQPVGIMACNAALANVDGALLDGTYLDLFGRRTNQPLTLARLLRRNTVFISCLVPRAAGDAVGWFDPQLFGTEDHDLWLKILESGHRVVVEREPIAVYRRTRTSISRNVARQAHNNQKTLRATLRRGQLTPRQQRIAVSELRYNRALEVVAAMVFDRHRPSLGTLPNLAWVALTRPHHWRDWLRAFQQR